MTHIDILAGLSSPTQFWSAPFGVDIQAFSDALQKRGGIGLYVARDDRTAVAAVQMAQFMSPRLEAVFLPGWD
ncbi:MAG: hypothetical protein AAGJ29_09955, partial [Pseudomonadota bacterium]